jgi:hypothetical protein
MNWKKIFRAVIGIVVLYVLSQNFWMLDYKEGGEMGAKYYIFSSIAPTQVYAQNTSERKIYPRDLTPIDRDLEFEPIPTPDDAVFLNEKLHIPKEYLKWVISLSYNNMTFQLLERMVNGSLDKFGFKANVLYIKELEEEWEFQRSWPREGGILIYENSEYPDGDWNKDGDYNDGLAITIDGTQYAMNDLIFEFTKNDIKLTINPFETDEYTISRSKNLNDVSWDYDLVQTNIPQYEAELAIKKAAEEQKIAKEQAAKEQAAKKQKIAKEQAAKEQAQKIANDKVAKMNRLTNAVPKKTNFDKKYMKIKGFYIGMTIEEFEIAVHKQVPKYNKTLEYATAEEYYEFQNSVEKEMESTLKWILDTTDYTWARAFGLGSVGWSKDGGTIAEFQIDYYTAEALFEMPINQSIGSKKAFLEAFIDAYEIPELISKITNTGEVLEFIDSKNGIKFSFESEAIRIEEIPIFSTEGGNFN